MVLKFDKVHYKPYFSCLCGMRIFIKHNLSMASLFSWSQTLERLNIEELKNLLQAGGNSLNIARQQLPELEKWSNTEEALTLTANEGRS